MDKVAEFIESIEVENTAKVVKFVMKNVKEDIENYGMFEMEEFILNLKPNSSKNIMTIVYVLSLYAKWLYDKGIVDNDDMYHIVNSLDKNLLWMKAKPNANKKFISYEEFNKITHEISLYEEYNSLYYESLFRSVYEGIYNDDLSVIKNLKKSDIDGNVITLHEDNGHSYKLKISDRLSKDLKELADVNVWERRNRFSVCQISMRGAHKGSVFKIEDRKTASSNSYKFTYYSKLRKIVKEYLERPLIPLQLYASGIMHRVKVELNENNISLEEAFTKNSRNRMAHQIISKELIRCNSSIELGNFRELVKGHLDSF